MKAKRFCAENSAQAPSGNSSRQMYMPMRLCATCGRGPKWPLRGLEHVALERQTCVILQVQPGNVLAATSQRKSWSFYWGLYNLGAATLADEDCSRRMLQHAPFLPQCKSFCEDRAALDEAALTTYWTLCVVL